MSDDHGRSNTLPLRPEPAPAFAAPSKYDRYAEQQREEQPSIYAGMSWHCQQVMARPDMAGDRQVSYCRENLF